MESESIIFDTMISNRHCFSISDMQDIIWADADTSLECVFVSGTSEIRNAASYSNGEVCCTSPSGSNIILGDYQIWLGKGEALLGRLNNSVLGTHCSGTCDTCIETEGCHWCLSTHTCTIQTQCIDTGIVGCPSIILN